MLALKSETLTSSFLEFSSAASNILNIKTEHDYEEALEVIELMEGMPYQTLVSSILHKFIDGQLIDKSANN